MKEMEKEKKEKAREDRMATGGFVVGYVKSLENRLFYLQCCPVQPFRCHTPSMQEMQANCFLLHSQVTVALQGLLEKGKELATRSLMRAL